MFNWIKKKIIKSIISDITKSVPSLKERGSILIEEYKNEFIEKIKKIITAVVNDFIKSFDNKKN